MTGDTKEMVEQCLSCERPICINCYETLRKSKYNGEKKYGFNVRQEAKRLGIPYTTFYQRLVKGGYEYAVTGKR